MKRVLDLGCGRKKRPGAIGVDCNASVAADIVHDLNQFPYPFEDGEFDEIHLEHVLEHLDDVVRVVEEVFRICRPGGMVKVIVPYFRSHLACMDPTHKHFFTVNSFAYFEPSHPFYERYAYTRARFRVTKIVFNEMLEGRWFKRFVVALANRWPRYYEYYFSQLAPVDTITYDLERCL